MAENTVVISYGVGNPWPQSSILGFSFLGPLGLKQSHWEVFTTDIVNRE